jgi:hypothetical protein
MLFLFTEGGQERKKEKKILQNMQTGKPLCITEHKKRTEAALNLDEKSRRN